MVDLDSLSTLLLSECHYQLVITITSKSGTTCLWRGMSVGHISLGVKMFFCDLSQPTINWGYRWPCFEIVLPKSCLNCTKLLARWFLPTLNTFLINPQLAHIINWYTCPPPFCSLKQCLPAGEVNCQVGRFASRGFVLWIIMISTFSSTVSVPCYCNYLMNYIPK